MCHQRLTCETRLVSLCVSRLCGTRDCETRLVTLSVIPPLTQCHLATQTATLREATSNNQPTFNQTTLMPRVLQSLTAPVPVATRLGRPLNSTRGFCHPVVISLPLDLLRSRPPYRLATLTVYIRPRPHPGLLNPITLSAQTTIRESSWTRMAELWEQACH